MNFLAVRGHGDPNEENGAYKQAIGLLYAVAYTIKMSKMGSHKMDGYFDYVVPPLEGLWWQEGIRGVDYTHKEDFCWISMIRLPDFVTKAEFDWAVQEASRKKKLDCFRWSSSPGRKVCASSVCTSALTMTSPLQLPLWRNTPKRTVTRRTLVKTIPP